MPPIRQNSNESQRRPLTGGSQSTTRLEGMRAGLQQLFTGRSSVGPSRERESDMEELRSPKTPVLSFRENELPSTHIRIPGLVRTGTWTSIRTSSRRSSRNSERSDVPETPRSTRPITPESLQRTITNRPAPVYTPHVRSNSGSRFVGVDPAEAELAQLADTGRRRRRRRARPMAGRGCAPKIKNKKIRSKILSTVVSAIFLTLMLTIYLALALSNREESQEFHVLLILIILVTTIFFCHALIRLCMMLINPPPDEDEHPRAFPGMLGPGGFADPAVPIRVALARDEEAAGIESEATKVPPPAYGLWRESVRVDPNRIFWQRNNAQQQTIREENERPQTANRPPSYISENGIDYVVEAAPRHITPTTDVPLPPHPSERGRWNMPSPHS